MTAGLCLDSGEFIPAEELNQMINMTNKLPPHPEHTMQWSPREQRVLVSHFDKAIEPLQKRIAKLEAQLASGQEPVAQWQRRHLTKTNGHWENTDEHDAKWFRDNAMAWDVRVLYTHPTPAQQPLSDEQKQRIHDETGAGHALISLVEMYIKEKP